MRPALQSEDAFVSRKKNDLLAEVRGECNPFQLQNVVNTEHFGCVRYYQIFSLCRRCAQPIDLQ